MEWKIILENYLGALVIFVIWFVPTWLSGWVFDGNGKLKKGLLVINCFIFVMLFVGATIHVSVELANIRKEQITPEEKQTFSPKVDIKLFPSSDKAVTPHQYPLKQYNLGIQNLNSNSVPIYDFRINFIFKNEISEIKSMPLLSVGSLTVSGVNIYKQNKDGSIFTYEEQPIETATTGNFSLAIQKVKINEKDINTNIVVFNCAKWPEKASYSAKIVVDLSKIPEVQKMPDKIGKYEGIYFYEIKGKKFSERISGVMPDSGNEKGDTNTKGTSRIYNTDIMIKEIEFLLHEVIDSELFGRGWSMIENNFDANVHPFVRDAFIAHKQIQNFIKNKNVGTTPEIMQLAKIAFNINLLKRSSVEGIDKQLKYFFSSDYKNYLPARYAIQIASALKKRGHEVAFINGGSERSLSILVSNGESKVEIICEHVDIKGEEIDYIQEIYKKIQDVKKFLPKTYPGIITIEIDEEHYIKYEKGNQRLKEEIDSLMKNDNSISAILLTCNIFAESTNEFIYRTNVFGFKNENAICKLPDWLENNFITQTGSDFSIDFHVNFGATNQ